MEELLRQGINPYRPVVDDHGVDLMLLNGLRLQVKSAHLSAPNKGRSRSYVFSCAQNVYGIGYRRIQKRRTFANECDFVIFVGLDQRRFWILPATLIDAYGDMSIVMRECDSAPTLLKINEMLGKGMLKTEIAKELGCCETTIWKRGKGFRERNCKLSLIRSYEDRWDLVVNPEADKEAAQPSLPKIYERNEDFVATLAGPIAA